MGELVKKDQKRRKKLQEAGIEYDYPEIVSPSNSYTEVLDLSSNFEMQLTVICYHLNIDIHLYIGTARCRLLVLVATGLSHQ